MRNAVIGSFIGFVLAAAFLAACGGGAGGSDAVPQVSNDELADLIVDLQARMVDVESRLTQLEGSTQTAAETAYDNASSGLAANNVQAAVDEVAARTGSVFVRWGNDTAPAGTTLLHAGYAFGGSTTDTGATPSQMVVKANDPGATVASTNAYGTVYPDVTYTDNELTASIPFGRLVPAAVCWSPTPTTVVWGTHTAPAGWRVLYKGYAMGSNAAGNGKESICVDVDSFSGAAAKENHGCSLYGVIIGQFDMDGFPGYTGEALIKAAVIAKDAP